MCMCIYKSWLVKFPTREHLTVLSSGAVCAYTCTYNVHVLLRTHTRMHAYRYTCTFRVHRCMWCVCACVCEIDVCMHMCICMYTYVYTYTCMYTYTHMHTYTCPHAYAHTYNWGQMYTYTPTCHIHMQIHVHIHIHIHVHTRIIHHTILTTHVIRSARVCSVSRMYSVHPSIPQFAMGLFMRARSHLQLTIERLGEYCWGSSTVWNLDLDETVPLCSSVIILFVHLSVNAGPS